MQVYDSILAIHIYSLYASGFLIAFYMWLTQSAFKSEFSFIRRIRLFLPVYYLFLAIVFFTGCVLLALKHFALNENIIFMCVAWCGILGLNIFLYKKFKKAQRFKRYKFFRGLSFFILLLCLLLLLTPFLCEYYEISLF